MPANITCQNREISVLKHEIKSLVSSLLSGQEDSETMIDGLALFQRSQPEEACPCLYTSSVIVMFSGAKQMLIDGLRYRYDENQLLVTSMDLPASTQVLEASPDNPCIGLSLHLDRSIIAELVSQMPPIPRTSSDRLCVDTCRISASIIDPIKRLLALTNEPGSIALLAPAIKREIHYRLLQSEVAPLLYHIAAIGSTGHRIFEAIKWLRSNYAEPMRIEALAADLQMSTSSLHHHFRKLTGRSPLQYQKWLRLSEARRFMINQNMDAATASWRVGYESPSHFSRDYKKLFGQPPKVDTRRKPESEHG